MNAKPHSPEWLIANADHGVAFERACASALERLLTENANLQQQLEAIGAGGVGPLMPPVAERPGVPMPSRSLVDQVIREIARYCNTGEMDDAESLLAELQCSIDPAQQPPTTEQSSAVERPQGEQEPDAFYEWWNMRPSLTRLQAWLLWKDQAKAEGGAA